MSLGRISSIAAIMPAMVSPVMVGADAASPQPTAPASDSIRTKTFSACATVSPAICTGFFIGRLTAMASIVEIFIFTVYLPAAIWAAPRPNAAASELELQVGPADKECGRKHCIGQRAAISQTEANDGEEFAAGGGKGVRNRGGARMMRVRWAIAAAAMAPLVCSVPAQSAGQWSPAGLWQAVDSDTKQPTGWFLISDYNGVF